MDNEERQLAEQVIAEASQDLLIDGLQESIELLRDDNERLRRTNRILRKSNSLLRRQSQAQVEQIDELSEHIMEFVAVEEDSDAGNS